jgi:hypothetical protein
VVLVERNVNADYEGGEDMGGVPDPRKTVIAFRPVRREVEDRMLTEFVLTYKWNKWKCPEVKHMDYIRSCQ